MSHKLTTIFIPLVGVMMLFTRSLFGIRSFFPVFDPKDTLFEQIFLHSPIAVCVTEETGIIQYTNHAFTQLTGYSANELVGDNFSLLKSSKNEPNFFEHFWKQLLTHNSFNGKIWNQHKDTHHALHSVTITPIVLDKTYYLSTHVNITKDVELQARHHYLTYHDPLTGLANRSLFEDRLSHAIDNAACTGHTIGILYCDLNEFKQINEDFGHTAGDNVLVEVAKRLQAFFQTNDTVARFRGNEFVIIVEHLKDQIHLSKMAENLKQTLAQPMNELNLSISASIGTASFPQDGLNSKQLLTIADHKMHHNKNRFYGLID